MILRHVVVLVALLFGCARVQAQSISLSLPSQFDTVLVNTTDSVAFWIRNAGSTPFVVTDINTTRAEFHVKDTAFAVPPNDSVRVFVYFRTNQNVTWKDVLVVMGAGGAIPFQWKGTGRYSEALYNSTQGLWENALKTALTNLITSHTSLGYNTARDRMFETVDDFNLSDTVECVYTGRRIRATSRTEAQNQNFDTEHTWPQGTFGQSEPMRSDLNHLYPTYSPANNARGSYPFGPVVSNVTWQEGGSKRGNNPNGVVAFEPRDTHKGDVSRAIFYFMLRYQNNYEGYLDQAQEGYLRQWHVTDPVSAKETQRNNRVATYQGKRNPLIDHPEFLDRISSFRSSVVPTLYPDIHASSNNISFGTVAVGDSVEWALIVLNNGRAGLSISGLSLQSPSSNFRIVNTPTVVPVDSFASVRIRFIPAVSGQSYTNTLIIQSNDPDEGTVNIGLGGTGSSGNVQTVLNTPANGATGVATPVVFTWYRPSGADRYHFQLSLTNTFSAYVADDSTLVDSSFSPSGLALNTTYHWRVRSHTAAGWGTYSATRNFTTWTVPAQVQPLSPANGASGTPIPTLCAWQTVSTATRYRIDLDTSGAFANPLLTDSTLVDTSRSIAGLLEGTTYYWRIRAGNSAGWGAFAVTRSFATWSTPEQIQAIAPEDEATGIPVPVQFTWHSSAAASRYQLDLAASGTFDSLLVADSSLTDTTCPVSGLVPNTTYYWRVRAGSGAGWGSYSGARSFTTLNVPLQVQLQSPMDHVRGVSSPVHFMWQASPGASSYRLDVSPHQDFNALVVSDSTLSDTSRLVAGLDTMTTYFWRVRARNNAGWGSFSSPRQFRIAAGLMVTLQMRAGWNIVSIPVVPPDSLATSIFPSAVSFAFAYTNGYSQRDSLVPGPGYWMNFGPSHPVSVLGEPIFTDTVEVNAGWNLVGAISFPISSATVTSLPPGIIMSPFYEFVNGYVSAATLQPLRGYWVRCSQQGSIILHHGE